MEGLNVEGPDKVDLPQLAVKYEAWNTKALVIVQNLMAERLEDFVSAYKKDRKTPINFSNYSIQDYLLGIKADHSSEAAQNAALLFKMLSLRQVGILSSVLKTRPVSESSSEVISQAEFYSRALDQAQKLFEGGKPALAGVLTAIVLENFLDGSGESGT